MYELEWFTHAHNYIAHHPRKFLSGTVAIRIMATPNDHSVHSASLQSALTKLKEELTCSICLKLYTDPRVLSCLHSFCQRCLESLRSVSYPVRCPVCRAGTTSGTSSLPVAFHLNNLREVYDILQKVFNHEQLKCDNCTLHDAIGYCKECNKFLCESCIDTHNKWSSFTRHNFLSLEDLKSSNHLQCSQSKKVMQCPSHRKRFDRFCDHESCQQLICHDCTIKNHKQHSHETISSSYHTHRQKLETSLKEQSDAIRNIQISLAQREGEVKEQQKIIKERIHSLVEEVIDVLRKSEKELTSKLDTITTRKLEILSKQNKDLEAAIKDSDGCKEFVEKSLQVNSHHEVLMSFKQMKQRIEQVSHKIGSITVQEKADIMLIENAEAVKDLNNFATVLTPRILNQCQIKKIDLQQLTIKRNSVSFPLSIVLPDSSPLIVPSSSISCNVNHKHFLGITTRCTTTVAVTVKDVGVYKIKCSPVVRGHHQVAIQVKDVQLGCVDLTVPFNPFLQVISPLRTINNINKPWGACVNNEGNLVVIEYSNNLVIALSTSYDRRLSSCLYTASKFSFSYICGIAVAVDGSIIVADCHRIQKIDSRRGILLKSIGKKGTGFAEFYDPCGIAVSPTTNEIYVADYGNSRICVLTANLDWSFAFGSKGSGQAQFNSPYDVAVDSKGHVYVADTYNHRIQKFTAIGDFICQFGSEGSGIGQFSYPYGITIDIYDMIYVSDGGNHRVSVFTSDGQFVRSFGSKGSGTGQFSSPHGLAFDSSGHLYVCDYDNKRIVVY